MAKGGRSGTTLTAAERRAAGMELLQGIWLPKALYERLERLREGRGLSRTAAVKAAIEEWIAKNK